MKMELYAFFLFATLLEQGTSLWTGWGKWGECSATCGDGVKRARERKCTTGDCGGERFQEKFCFLPACPSTPECNCGCILSEHKAYLDVVRKFNKVGTCIWQIETTPNSKIKLHIQDIQLSQGTIVVSDEKTKYKVINFGFSTLTESAIPFEVTSTTNRLNISVFYQGTKTTTSLRLQGKYETVVELPPVAATDKEKESKLNVPAVVGITACVVIIVIASFIIGYRKLSRSKEQEKNEDEFEEGMEDNYSSASSSNRSSRNKVTTKKRLPLQHRELSPPRNNNGVEQQRLMNGTELFIPTTNVYVASHGGYLTSQPFVNWPTQQVYTETGLRQGDAPDYLVKPGQIAYAPQVIYDPSQTYHYPISGPEC